MTTPAYDVALYLAAQGAGTFAGTVAWSINVAAEPIEPADAITLYDTGGKEPDTDELDLVYPTFQVRVRATSYVTGYNKQKAIRDLLILTENIAGFDSVQMSSDILAIGRDDKNRYLLTANYRTMKARN